jgi:hypothetical protein
MWNLAPIAYKKGLIVRQAINDETGEINTAWDNETQNLGKIPEIAKRLKAREQPWALIADENYGEVSNIFLLALSCNGQRTSL